MSARDHGEVLICELRTVLEAYDHLVCVPSVTVEEVDGGSAIRLTIDIRPEDIETIGEAMHALGLLHDLQYLQDLGSLRALARRYDIAPEKIEGLLPKANVEGETHG